MDLPRRAVEYDIHVVLQYESTFSHKRVLHHVIYTDYFISITATQASPFVFCVYLLNFGLVLSQQPVATDYPKPKSMQWTTAVAFLVASAFHALPQSHARAPPGLESHPLPTTVSEAKVLHNRAMGVTHRTLRQQRAQVNYLGDASFESDSTYLCKLVLTHCQCLMLTLTYI